MSNLQSRMNTFKNKVWELLNEYGINGENLGIEIECSSKFSELMSLAHHESVEEQNLFKNTIKKILNNNQNLNEQEIGNIFDGVENIIISKFIKMFNGLEDELYGANKVETECELLHNVRNFYRTYSVFLSDENDIKAKENIDYYEEEIKLTKLNEKIHKIPSLDHDIAEKEINELRKMFEEIKNFKMKHEYLIDNIESWKKQFEDICKYHQGTILDRINSASKNQNQEYSSIHNKQHIINDDMIK